MRRPRALRQPAPAARRSPCDRRRPRRARGHEASRTARPGLVVQRQERGPDGVGLEQAHERRAALAGTGFGPPLKFARKSGSHRSWIRRAPSQSPVRPAAQSETSSPGISLPRPRRRHRRRGRAPAASRRRRPRGPRRRRPVAADPGDLLEIARGLLDAPRRAGAPRAAGTCPHRHSSPSATARCRRRSADRPRRRPRGSGPRASGSRAGCSRAPRRAPRRHRARPHDGSPGSSLRCRSCPCRRGS